MQLGGGSRLLVEAPRFARAASLQHVPILGLFHIGLAAVLFATDEAFPRVACFLGVSIDGRLLLRERRPVFYLYVLISPSAMPFTVLSWCAK